MVAVEMYFYRNLLRIDGTSKQERNLKANGNKKNLYSETVEIPWINNEEGGIGKLNTHRVESKRAKGRKQATYLTSLCEWIAEREGER